MSAKVMQVCRGSKRLVHFRWCSTTPVLTTEPSQATKSFDEIPGPRLYPVIGNLFQVKQNTFYDVNCKNQIIFYLSSSVYFWALWPVEIPWGPQKPLPDLRTISEREPWRTRYRSCFPPWRHQNGRTEIWNRLSVKKIKIFECFSGLFTRGQVSKDTTSTRDHSDLQSPEANVFRFVILWRYYKGFRF